MASSSSSSVFTNPNKSTRGKRLFKRITGRKPASRKFSGSRTRGRSLSGR